MRLACKSGMGIAEENEIKKVSYDGVRESVLQFWRVVVVPVNVSTHLCTRE